MSRADRVAVIGLGAMGLPVAVNLRKAGVDVIGFSRSQASTNRASEAGVPVASTLQNVDAHIVLTVLPDMPQVRDVLEGGLRQHLQEGDILVVMGTVSPLLMRELHNELADVGIVAVDAAMSGGDVGAQNATMSIMFGGPQDTFDELLPDRKSTRLNSSHSQQSRMPSSA